jgi:hypothetical protein
MYMDSAILGLHVCRHAVAYTPTLAALAADASTILLTHAVLVMRLCFRHHM